MFNSFLTDVLCNLFLKLLGSGVSNFDIFTHLQLAGLIWTSLATFLYFLHHGYQNKGYFLLLIFSFLDWTMPFPSSSFLWLFFCKLLVSTILSSEFLNPLPSESTTARLDVVLLLRPYHHQEKEGNYVRQNSYLYSVGWWMSSLYDIVDSCSAVILCNTPQAQNNCFLSSHSPSCTFPDNIYPS